MTWAITLAIFLGTAAAVFIVILVWSRWAEIEKALKEHRRESRITAEIALELADRDQLFVERTTTENVSRHGARVLTRTRWRPNDRVLVSVPKEGERSPARIAYCDLLSEHSFAVGLQFSSTFTHWHRDLNRSDHPYRK